MQAGQLYVLQCDAKRLLEAALGSAQRHELSILIGGATPRSPRPLTFQVKRTIPLLRDLERANPGPIVAVSFNASAFADRLQTEQERVEALCQAAVQADHAAVGSRCDADNVAAEVDRVFPPILQVFESLSHLAGAGRLVRRLRAH